MTLNTTITRSIGGHEAEIPVVVDFDYLPAVRASLDSEGQRTAPDDDAEIIINSVKHISGGKPLELTAAEQEQIEAECWEHVEDKQ
jgi:hypothetical protein